MKTPEELLNEMSWSRAERVGTREDAPTITIGVVPPPDGYRYARLRILYQGRHSKYFDVDARQLDLLEAAIRELRRPGGTER